MKKLTSVIAGLASAAFLALSNACAEGNEVAGDNLRAETIPAGGANVAPAAGADAPASGAGAEGAFTPAPPPETSGIPAAAHKARLAVLPAIFSEHFHPVFKFGEKIEVSGQADLKLVFTAGRESRLEAPSFTLSLTEAFVASRKFDVLERARLDETLKEIDFGESDYADAAKAVSMGQALNAEYVVLPEIEVVHLVEDSEETPYVGTVRSLLKGKMIVRSRVVDTGSTKLVAVATEEVQVERKLKENNPFLQSEIDNLIIDLYRAAGSRMVQRTLEAVYPVRLLEVLDGTAVLNRGEGAIAAGDEFEVYVLGKAYVDPDTGETLGQGETKVARLRVTRVAPKFSEAEILEGASALGGDPASYLCRETAQSIQAKTTASRNKMSW